MKSFLFISDFDGTITAQDFFKQILLRYDPEKIFNPTGKRGFELLKETLEGINLKQEEFEKEIEHIPMDLSFIKFYKFFNKNLGDILILSAGSKYYIEKKLGLQGLKNLKIIANEGFFKNGKFKLKKNEEEKFKEDEFGVSKEKVVLYYKNKYEKIAYAGDSYVDFKASCKADLIFAKANLAKILKMFNMKFNEFKNFSDITKYFSHFK